jgi:hypothetical protein
VIFALVVFGSPNAMLADNPTSGRIVVPGDHFYPGEAIAILGSQIGGRQVDLAIGVGPDAVALGHASVGSDGTFEANATVPASAPLGYVELTATDENGNVSSTIILIGDRAEGPGGLADPATTTDERLLWLALLSVGLVIFAVALGAWFRGRRQGTASRD